MLQLRDYQHAAHDAILAKWGHRPYWDGSAETSRKTLAQLATSAGKTLIAAHLADTLTQDPENRVLFVADREELIEQPVIKFHKACGIMAAVHRGKDTASASAQVVVGSIQTLARRLPPGKPFTHIIDDECHRNADARAKLHEQHPNAKILGITATAFRKGLADLSKWYDTVAFELGTFDLIDQGYITPIKVQTVPLEVDLTNVKQKSGDYDTEQLDTAIEPHYRAIAKIIKEYAANRFILAFLPLIKSSKLFVEVLQQEGISARHCDGSNADRKYIIEQFDRGEFQVLSNSQVFSTGVDFIRADCLLNLSVTRSRGEYRQRAGRIMRLIPGTIDPGGVTMNTAAERKAAIAASAKPDCLVLDLLWQVKSLGLAGPASLIAMNEEEEKAVEKAIRQQRTPEELEQLSKQVQEEREAQLAKELEEQAKRAAQENRKSAMLMDARQLALMMHDRDMLNYEPVMNWERGSVSDKQAKMLASIGVEAKSVSCKGMASKVLDTVLGRQARGLAPIEAFAQLREKGVADPDKCTLDDAIRVLGRDFPMTYGKKYRCRPLKDVSFGFWTWLYHSSDGVEARKQVQERHPAVWRYLTKIVFPSKK